MDGPRAPAPHGARQGGGQPAAPEPLLWLGLRLGLAAGLDAGLVVEEVAGLAAGPALPGGKPS